MPEITPDQAGGRMVTKFLDLIAFSEGTSTGADRGYGVIVSGIDGHHSFTDYTQHPFAEGRAPVVLNHKVPPLESTASGRYQELLHNWTVFKVQLHLPDFSPLSQDLMAIEHLKERHDAAHVSAYQHIVNGDIQAAVSLCAAIWASMPGNSYGQGGRTMPQLMAQWTAL